MITDKVLLRSIVILWGLYNNEAALKGFLRKLYLRRVEEPMKKTRKNISRRENIMCQDSEMDENVAHS